MNARNRFTWRLLSILVVLSVLIPATLLAPTPVAEAANTDFRSPTANYIYTTGFTNPDNAHADGGGVASRVDNANGVAHVYRDYNFPTIPAGAVIQGIQVRLDWYLNSTSSTNEIRVYLSWNGGTDWTAYQAADDESTSTSHTETVGGTTNTWGRTWNVGDFTNANFRVRLELSTGSTSRDFYIDWVPVQVTYNRYPNQPQLVSPTDDTTTNDNTPTLDWDPTTDPDGDTLTYSYRYTDVGGGTWGSWTNTTGGQTQVTLGTLADGLRRWQARACDPSNFCTESEIWSFTVDATAPSSNATAPTYANAAPFTVSATASDAGSGVNRVTLYFRGPTGNWTSVSTINAPGPYQWNFTPGLGDGTYYFQSVACDNANNCQTAPSGSGGTGNDSTIYDATPPTSSATPPGGQTSVSPIAIPWTANGAVSGIPTDGITLWYNYNGGAYTADGTASGSSGTFNFTPSNDGTYCFYTIARDNAGNVESPPGGANGDGCTTFRTRATIGDFVWQDTDGDGAQDIGEPGFDGVTLTLSQGGSVISTTITTNGFYRFSNLVAGTYTVTVSIPPGWAQTNFQEHPLVVTVATAQDYNDADFGLSQNYANISGYVWYDPNRNGVRDPGEGGINAVNVVLRRGATVVGTANTNANGFYFFGGLAAGNYQVDVDQNDADLGVRVLTTPDPLNVPGVVVGQSYSNRNFGFAEPAPVIKSLYLRRNDVLDRTRPMGTHTSFQINDGTSHTWTQSPTMAGPLQFTTSNITVWLYMDPTSGFDWLGRELLPSARVTLRYGGTTIGTSQQLDNLSGGGQWYSFSFAHPTSLAAGNAFSIQIDVFNSNGGILGSDGNVVVYYDSYPDDNHSRIELPVYSYLRIDSANSGTYDAAYPGGAANDTFLTTDNVFFRARATDPFGNYDISGATLTIPGVITNTPMTRYTPNPDAATAIYQYSRSGFTLGSYTYVMSATEGAEGEVSAVYTGTFRIIISDLTESFKEARSWPAPQLITQTVPGAEIEYTVHISNTGDALAPNVTITDAIPAHATYVLGTVNGGNYNSTLNAITWSGSLAGRSERVITFRVTLDPVLDNGLAIDNVVLINDDTNTFSRNNRVTIVSAPNLSTSSKAADRVTAEPGDVLAYTIVLTNTGDMNASASLTDVVPINTTFVQNSLSCSGVGNCSYSFGDRTISWNGTVPGLGADPVVVAFRARVDSPLDNGTIITNTAFIDDGFAPNGTTPIQRQVVTTIQSEPLIQAYSSKIVDEQPTATPGATLHYHIYLVNGGKMNAPTVYLTDTIPAHTTYVNGSLRTNNIGTATWDSGNGRITWIGPVNPGAPVEIHFNVRADSVLDNGTIISNTATVNDNYHPSTFDLSASTTIVSAPDLRTSYKTVSPSGTVPPGQALSYEIHLINTGNMTVTTRITDTLSPDLVNVTVVSPPEATYNPGPHTITWAGNVGPGPDTVIRFTANVRNPMGTPQTIIYNTATINDGVHAPYDIFPPTQTTVNASPDLSTSRKAVSATAANPGDVLTYTIRLTNTGNMNTVASVQDVMPNQTTYLANSLSFSAGSGSYDTFNRWIQWDGPANPGAPVVITYAVTIDAVMNQPDTTIYNDARINDNVHQPFLTPGATTTVHAEPNLSTSTKTVDLDSAAPGQQLWYRIRVHNSGNMVAYGAAVSDTLPVQVTYLSGQFPTGGGYNATGRYIYWNGDVTPGTDVVIDYYVTVNDPLDDGTLIENTAEIRDGYAGHPVVVTDPANARTVVNSAPNLGTSTKTVDKGTAAPGDVLTYTVTLLNTGNMNARGALVTDTIPVHTSYVTGTVSASSGSASYDSGNNRILWNGDVDKGVPVVITFRVQTDSPLDNGTLIDNTAEVYDGYHPATLSRTARTEIGSAPNLSASSKTVDRATAEPGDVLTYTIVLRNTGNQNATNVSLNDALPANVAYVPGSVTGGASYGGGTVTWNGAVNAGARITFTYRVTVSLPLDNNTLIENTATVNDGVHPAFDTTPPAQTLIQSTPNLLTSNKVVSRGEAAPGDTLVYTITLRNTGKMMAHSASLYDILPAQLNDNLVGLPYASSGNVSYTSYNHRLVWNGSVSPLQPVTVVFTATIRSPLNDGTQIINNATIGDGIHSTFDTEPAITIIHAAPILTTSTKAVNLGEATPGAQLRYTIVLTNTGNMVAQGSVVDQLPGNVAYFSGPTASSGSATWDGFNNRVLWNGQVVPGTAVVIQYYATVNNPVDNDTVITNTCDINDGFTTDIYNPPAASTHITSQPNLSTSTKVVDKATAAPGEELLYTITLNNTGNMVAHNAWMTDTLPANTDWAGGLTWTGGNATWDGSRVRWDGDVSGTPVVIRFRVRLNSPLPNNTTITNTATLNDGFAGHASLTRQATTTVRSAPDLSTSSKTVNAASAHPGDVLTYTITLLNTGNMVATGATVNDVLPPNVSFNAMVSPIGTYNAGSNAVTWTGPVTYGMPVVIQYRVAITSPLNNGTVIANAATVNDGFPGHPAFDTTPPAQTTIQSEPNLSTSTKTVNAATASPGQVITYTITLTNSGNMNAAAYVLDGIPAHASYQDGTAQASSGSVTFNLYQNRIEWNGTVPAGAPVTVRYAVQIASSLDNGTLIWNTATVGDGVHAPFDTAAANTTITSAPNLRPRTTKTANLGDVNPGGLLRYTINVVNDGNMVAGNAQVVDVLPPQVTYASGPFASSGSAAWDSFNNQVVWSGAVLPDAPVTIQYDVRANDPLDDGTLITNTATANDNFPGHAAFETAPVTTTVHSAPNLSTSTKGVDRANAAPGDVLLYTITLNNTGNMNAYGARVTDTIPISTTYVPGSVSPNASYDTANNRILWTGTVTRGVPVVITFRTTITSPLPNGTVIHNVAQIYDGFQPTVVTRTADTEIGSAPNLQTSTKTVNRGTAEPGDVLTYTIVLRNTGNQNATSVTLSDALPANVTYVPGSVTGGATHNGAALSWSGQVNAGAALTFTYRVTANLPLDNNTLIENSATVNDGVHSAFDTTPPAQTVIQSTPNLLTSDKAVSRSEAAPGDTLVYTITLRNTGKMTAHSALLNDTLPAQVDILGQPYASSGNVSYTGYNRRVSWNGSVSPLQPVTVVFTVTIRPPQNDGDQIINSATVGDGIHSTFETDPAITIIHSAPNLATSTKTVDRATAVPGNQLRYTIVLTNTGNMVAQGNVVDQLPANVTYFSGPTASSGSATWDGFNNRILWNGQVVPGTAVVIQYYATVNNPTDDGTLITNTATVNDGFPGHVPFEMAPAAQTVVHSAPDLSTSTKVVDKATAAPGEELLYTITLNNTGNMVAHNAWMTDTLPANTAWADGLTWTGGSATWDGSRVRWDGDVSGTPVVIRFRVQVHSPLPNNTSIVNTATINDGFTGHASLTRQATTTVRSAPDLSSSSKTVDRSTAHPGEWLVYTLSLVNTGNMTATGASVTDVLPTNTDWNGWVAQNGATYNAGTRTVAWTGAGGPGSPVVIQYRVAITSPLNNGTSIANTATINDGFPGHTPFDTTPATQTTIQSAPDLSTSRKTVNTGTASPGQVITYTITLTNTGDMNASAYVLDGIPANTSYVDPSVWVSSGAVVYNPYQSRIEWNGTVPVGAPVTVRYAVQIASPLDDGTLIWNTATVGDGVHAPFDTQPANTRVTAAPNLQPRTTKTANLSEVAPGGLLRYTINVVNDGSMTASNAQVVDALPPQVTFANGPFASSGSAVWDSFNNQVVWSGAVAPGTPVTIQYDVTVNNPLNDGTPIANAATVNDNFPGHSPFQTTPAAQTTVRSAPNLGTSTKGVDQGTANPGARLHYTITLNNGGNMNATNVTVVDTLPSLYATLVATPTGAIYNPVAGTLTWSGLTVNRNQPVILTFDVDLAGAIPNGTRIVNHAEIADGFHPGTLAREATTIIGSAPNLSSSSKTVDRATAAPNDTLVYTITLRNTGNAVASGARITDTLPVNTSWVGWVAQNGAVRTGNVITWTGNVAPNVNQVIAFQVRVNTPLDNNTVIANTATVNDGVNPVLTIGPAQTTISSAPDLATSSKAVDMTTAAPGQQLVYTITLRNTGNMVAHSAEVLDYIPAHSTYVANSVTASGGVATYQSLYNRIRWTGEVTPGVNVVITFRAQLDFPLDQGTQISNWATVDDRFHTPPSDTNTVVTTIAAVPDMRGSSKAVSRATASPDDQLDYTITLVNNGSMTANARMDDVLPGDVTFVSGPVVTGGGSGGYDNGTRRIYWSGTVPPNQTVTVVYYVRVNNPLDNNALITNTATISDGYAATFATNQVQTLITSAPALTGSTKTVDRATANPGDRLRYTITLNNSGSMNATNVTVVDTLPLAYATLVATPTGAVYNPVAGTLTWNGLTVNRNQPVVLTFDMDLAGTIPNGTAIVNHAEIADGFHPGVLVREATTTIGSAPNLTTSGKEVSQTSAAPNDTLVYTITLHNSGNATAVGARITDTLPVNTSWVGWVAQNGAVRTGNVITWTGNVGTTADQVIAFQVRVNTPLDNNTTIVNSATVNDSFAGHTPFTISAPATVVHSAPNLGTSVKAVSLTDARPGNQLVYTITLVNNGNMIAHNTVVLDDIPANTSYVSSGASSGQVQYQPASDRIRWTGAVTPGVNVVITLRVQVATSLNDLTRIDNLASVDDGVNLALDTNTVTTLIHADPNLSTSGKTVDLADAAPGQSPHYVITLRNTGDMIAAGTRITDVIPANTTYVPGSLGASSGIPIWDPVARRVTWNGQVVPDANVTIEYYVTINSPLDDGTLITNTATVNDGRHPAFETAATQTTVHSQPDLSGSTKTVDRATAAPGEVIEYTITLRNSGNMNARNVVITDTLPANTTWNSWVTQNGAVRNGNVITWTGNVAVGVNQVIAYSVRLDAGLHDGDTVTNTATVDDGRGNVFDIGPAVTTVGHGWGINLTDGRDTVQPGERITYTIAFSGTDPLASGWVGIDIPANTTFVNATSGYQQSDNRILWPLVLLPPGFSGQRLLVVDVNTPLDNETVISTTAFIAGGSQSNSMTDADTVVSHPDLTNSYKEVSNPGARAGQLVTYRIILTNTGNMHAYHTTITDTIPASMTFEGNLAASRGISPTYTGGEVRWNGEVRVGMPVVIAFDARVGDTVPEETVIENVVSINDGVNEETMQRGAVIAVGHGAPPSGNIYLPIILNGSSGGPPPGGSYDIELTIRNCGNANAVGAFWVDLYLNPNEQSPYWPPRDPYNGGYDWFGQGAGFVVSSLGANQRLTLRLADADPRYKNVPATLSGPPRLYAQVDWTPVPDGVVYEGAGGEENNFFPSGNAACSATPGLPDLIVESIRVVSVTSGQVAPQVAGPTLEGSEPAPPRPPLPQP